ncbi:MAG: zinc-ribbon domain-containing protein [Methyloversatilis sp.]|nr:zinc-ribbon domain-containing protein [Methyloversatilis sp.]MBP6194427.1 zinc-ribbon domain-containing protein [Methyloversatilis sp.]MBP9117164.1 zinc-ribbon domain-containing protein [Methyloversatilis sp.]
MLSRCPACATVFRVDTAQIRARDGRVRCGRCQAVFDALDAMVDVPAVAGIAAHDAQITAAPTDEAATPPAPISPIAVPIAVPEESHATLNLVDAPEAEARSETSAVTTEVLDLARPMAHPGVQPGENMEMLVERTTDYWQSRTADELNRMRADALQTLVVPDTAEADLNAVSGLDDLPGTGTDQPADLEAGQIEDGRQQGETEAFIIAHSAAATRHEADSQPGGASDVPSEPAYGPGVDASGEAPSPAGARDPLLEPLPAQEPVRDPAMQRIRRELYGDEAPAARSVLKTTLWVIGCLLLALLAAGQLGYHFRSEIARTQPALKPLLENACVRLGCTVPAPRQPDQVSIEASELTPEAGREPLLRLSALLRNSAGFAQDWPHLELTLTDTADRAVVRRVLSPADYLPAGAPSATFDAASEQSVSLLIDPADSGAGGYRLYVFYP